MSELSTSPTSSSTFNKECFNFSYHVKFNSIDSYFSYQIIIQKSYNFNYFYFHIIFALYYDNHNQHQIFILLKISFFNEKYI